VINREFLKAGHLPTLLSAFFYFDMSFMVWVMLGPLAVQISQDLQLNAAQKGFMVALPVLAGALLRVVNGILVDHLRPRRAGLIGQVVVIVGLAVAWSVGVTTYAGTFVAGDHLGVAGRSFAVALPLASRWYPPQFQGTALGIAGAGNSGPCSRRLLAPGPRGLDRLAERHRTRCHPAHRGVAVYLFAAKDSPSGTAAQDLEGVPDGAQE
jgi:NNP family nitrate/nitrite transporter-like MFS transporter